MNGIRQPISSMQGIRHCRGPYESKNQFSDNVSDTDEKRTSEIKYERYQTLTLERTSIKHLRRPYERYQSLERTKEDIKYQYDRFKTLERTMSNTYQRTNTVKGPRTKRGHHISIEGITFLRTSGGHHISSMKGIRHFGGPYERHHISSMNGIRHLRGLHERHHISIYMTRRIHHISMDITYQEQKKTSHIKYESLSVYDITHQG
ncbi:hypothetical protein DPMN_017735 [Dreissena polymorpha]|uniref:Uncharacterized protein n=1 Tax=Dreissena polymorpha TaxID=45954 RepID=A0A9D4NBY7_DREPO|nr:hypothetical protein DPMN_017735 [Dreissena polymorpha]